jgi:hypothetical protein
MATARGLPSLETGHASRSFDHPAKYQQDGYLLTARAPRTVQPSSAALPAAGATASLARALRRREIWIAMAAGITAKAAIRIQGRSSTWPVSASKEKGPEPPMVKAAAAKPSTAGYSRPPSVAKKPLGAWTLAATPIVVAAAAPAAGVASPRAKAKTGSCFTDAREDCTGFCGAEPHGVHTLAGAFNASSAEPAEKFLGSVGDEHASETDPEQGLRGGRRLGAGGYMAHNSPPGLSAYAASSR